jgi:hypothetical protein
MNVCTYVIIQTAGRSLMNVEYMKEFILRYPSNALKCLSIHRMAEEINASLFMAIKIFA